MEDKEFLELHNNITSFARGENPIYSDDGIDLPRLEDVENYTPEPVKPTTPAPSYNKEQIQQEVSNAVDKYFDPSFEGAFDAGEVTIPETPASTPDNTQNYGPTVQSVDANALPDDNELQTNAEALEKEYPSTETVWNDIVESDTAKAIRRTDAFKKYTYNKEEVLTEAREISKALKVSEDLVLSNANTLDKMREVYKAYEKEKDIDKVYERYPGLKGLAEKDSGAAALAIANLKDTKVAHGIIENAYVGFANDWFGLKRNMIGAEGFWGKTLTAADEAKLKQYENESKALKQVPDFFDAPVDNAVGKTVQQLVMQFRQYGPVGLLGAAAGYFGTKAAGALGGSLLGPTGSVAGTVAVNQLAKVNARKLGGMAARIGSGVFMFNELAGQYYLEARAYRNKAGGQQFTDDEARMMAGLQAAIETAIELGSTEAVLKIFSAKPATPATEEIKAIINKAGNKATAIAMLQQKLKEIGGKTFKSGTVETAEEMSQQLSTDLVGNVFAAYVAPDGHDKYGLKVRSLPELFESSLEAGKEALVPSFTMAGMGAGFSTIGVVNDTMNAMKIEEVIKGVGLDYDNWMKNTKGVNMLRELKEKFAETKLAKEHPEEAQALLKETLKDSGFEEVYVDTKLVKEEEGGSELLYQMAADAGITEEEAKNVIENGEKLAVPTDVYAKNIKDHKLAEKLLDQISFNKEGECLERSRKYIASLKRGWDTMIDQESQRKMEAAYKVIKDEVGEDVAMDAMGIVSMYPQDPAAGAKKRAEENRQIIDRELKPIIDTLQQDVKNAADESAPQAQWYQDWMEDHDKAPTQKELQTIARDMYTGNGDYHIAGWEAAETMEEEDRYQENANRLEKLQAEAESYDKLSEKLKNYDAGKVAAAEGLTESGYAAYKYMVDAIKAAQTNKATQQSAAVGAMLWAHVAERFAEAYQSMGQDVTALDIIKRFKFTNEENGQGLNQKPVGMYSYEENQFAIKDELSQINDLEELEELASDDYSTQYNEFKNKGISETIDGLTEKLNQYIENEVTDPLGNVIRFDKKHLGDKEYVAKLIMDKSGKVNLARALCLLNLDKIVQDPFAIVVEKEHENSDKTGTIPERKVYISILKYDKLATSSVIVSVEKDNNGNFINISAAKSKGGNRKNPLKDLKKHLSWVKEFLYIKDRQSEYPRRPAATGASTADTYLSSYGTYILPQYYNSVNKLSKIERQMLSESDVQAEMAVLSDKHNGLEYKNFKLKAPDGSESEYSLLQWLLIRTQAFKNRFGLWDVEAQRKLYEANKEHAVKANSDKFSSTDKNDRIRQAKEILKGLPIEVYTADGMWMVNENLPKSTFNHIDDKKGAIAPDYRIAALTTLREGIKHLIYLGEMADFYHEEKDQNENVTDRANDKYFGYWIDTDKGKRFVYLRILDSRKPDEIKQALTKPEAFENNKGKVKLYIHDVYAEAEIEKYSKLPYEKIEAEIEARKARKEAGDNFGALMTAKFLKQPTNMKIGMLENGEPDLSQLDSLSLGQMDADVTGNNNFRQWFGDSKTVDADGKPIVFYHGTATPNITEFKHSKAQDKAGRAMAMGQGKGKFYFATTEMAANGAAQGAMWRGQGKTPMVMSVYLRLENPVDLETYAARYKEIAGHELNEGYSDGYTMKERDKFIAKLDKQLQKEGVDGIYDKGYGFAAVFNANQIKSVENQGTFDNSNNNIYMQQGQEKNLVAYHNITGQDLARALEFGGFPVPSLAIMKKDVAYDKYGEITLVGNKNMIDPQRGVPVYAKDGYTITFPKPSYSAPKISVVRKFKDKWKSFFYEVDDAYDIDRITDDYKNPDRMVYNLRDSFGFEYYYLTKVLGKNIEIPENSYTPRMTMLKNETYFNRLHDLVESVGDDKYSDVDVWLKDIAKVVEDYYDERIAKVKLQGIKNKLIEEKAKIVKDGVVEPEHLNKIFTELAEYDKAMKNPGKDYQELKFRVRRDFADIIYGKEYYNWVDEQIKELVGEGKVKIGNKLYPFTLENVTKYMVKNAGAAAEESFTFSAGKVAALASQKFKSIDEMHKAENKLGTEDEFNKSADEAKEIGNQYHTELAKYQKYKNEGIFQAFDDANECLAKAADSKGYTTIAKLRTALKKNGGFKDDIPDNVLQLGVDYLKALTDTTTQYFEAKPQRAINIGEFAGAVVPSDADPKLVKALTDAGLQIETYEAGDNAARQEATQRIQQQPDVLFQKQQNAKGSIEIQKQGEYIIHLMESADESTFMHEMAHGFFDMMKQMAQMENAPEQIVKDFETLRNWTEWNEYQLEEYKGTATYGEFAALDKKIREAKENGSVTVVDANGVAHTETYESLVSRWQQERFARGFEEYLRAGKSPTEGMKSIFSRFKNWLTKIYKGCIGVGAKPSDPVRAVMDRMIASQEEIDIAMRKAEMLKWKEAGAMDLLTKSSREYYEGLLKKAREDAEKKVLKVAMKDLDESNKAERQKALDKIRQDTEAQMRELPVFVIEQYLKQNPELDVESVCQMLGNMSTEEYQEQLEAQGGSLEVAVDKVVQDAAKRMEPNSKEYREVLKAAAEEAVATSKYTALLAAYEFEAYKKAVQRIRRLESRLKKIETTDESERKRAEADIVKEETAIAEQEDRDQRVRDLRDELKNLKDDVRVYGKSSLDDVAQARDYAFKRLETLSVGEATDFRKWGNLYVRIHQDAMNLFAAGKREEAVKLLKDGLVYRMLEKRAYELNSKYEKKIARMAARSKTISRENSMEANDRYLYNHLLYLFGLSDVDAPKPTEFPGVMQQIALGADGITDENVPESAWLNPEDWLQHIITGELPMENGLGSLSVEQFRQVEELMQYVYFTGKDRHSIKTLVDDDGNKATMESVNIDIAEEADKKRSLRDTRVNIGSDSPLEIAIRAARNYKVELLKAETILKGMGESAMKYIYNPLRKCADKELKLNQGVVEKQHKIFSMYHDDVIQAMGKKEGEKFLKEFSSKKRYLLGGGSRFKDSVLTHEELVCLALNLGTEVGHKRVLDIYELTEGKLRDLLYNLSGADWNLIQNIWDLHEEYWPDLQKVTENVTGVTMEKQAAREFTVTSKDGVVYPIKGGYYHLAYDPTKNLKVNQREADKRLDVQSGSNRRFALGVGMTKERSDFEVKYALKLNLGVMQRALAETVHYISFYETVRDVNRLINSDDFANTVVNYFGEEHYKTLQKWVKDAWALEPESKNTSEALNAAMRSNQTMASLGFSTITAIENALNIFPMMAEIGPINALKAVTDYYGTMFRTGVTEPLKMFDQNAFIAEHSIFMAERGESIDPNIHKAQADNGLNADNIIKKGFKSVEDAAFYFITQTDLMLGRPLWMHEYQRVYNECIEQQLDPEVAERKAVQAGDAAVRHVFGSSADIDRAEIQRSTSEITKFATMFYSYFSTVHNAMVAKGYEYQEGRRQGKNMMEASQPLVWGALMWYLMPAIGSAVMRAYLKGNDDDQEPEAIAKKIASTLSSNVMGGLPFLRDIIPMTLDMAMGERIYGFRTIPVYEVYKQAMQTANTIAGFANNKKDGFDVMRSLARVSVYMSKFPLSATNAMITAAQWIDQGGATDEEMAEYLRAIIMNKKPKK